MAVPVHACGLVISVRNGDPAYARLADCQASRERTGLWEQEESDTAMAQVLANGRVACVEAVHERGMHTTVFGYGFLLFPQQLPQIAHDLLGGSELFLPRIVVVVSSVLRGQGVGREITQQLLALASAQELSVPEVEADDDQRLFFERTMDFHEVSGGVRRHRLGDLVLLRRQLT